MKSSDMVALRKTNAPDEILIAATEGRISLYWFNAAQIESRLLTLGGKQLSCASAYHRFLRIVPYDIGRLMAAGESVEISSFEPTDEEKTALENKGLADGMRFMDNPVRVDREMIFVEKSAAMAFDQPDTEQPTSAERKECGIGIPYKELIEGFNLDHDKWAEKLRRKKRRKNYQSALCSPGVRRKGASATFNPAIFGALLIKNKEPGYQATRVEAIIEKHFPSFLDEWAAERQELD
jgi:hypothetical protein